MIWSFRAPAARFLSAPLAPLALALALAPPLAAAQAPIEAAMRYTVKVVTVIDHPFGYEDKGRSTGSGFLVDRARGWIVTNAHVAGRSPSRIRVNFRNGDPIAATKLHVDALVDLAVLAIPPGAIPGTALEAGLDCGAEAVPGQAVIAFGHPWGLDFTATRGIVSSVRSTFGVEKLQTDAAVNSGNSGGPLIAEETGRLIGINFARMGGRSTNAEGLNLAVPARYACTILGLLREGRDPAPPLLPVAFAETRKDRELVVGSVGAAWAGALRAGDRVLSVNGDGEARYASRLLDIARGATSLRLGVRRGEAEREVELQVPAERWRVAPLGLAVSGMVLASGAAYGQAEDSVAVHHVDDASAAEEAELRTLDEIVAVAGTEVTSLAQLRALLEARRGEEVELVVRRSAARNEAFLRALRLEVDAVEALGPWK